MEMIHESGIPSVSARSLGSRVGMNSALIYRYFRDIDEVVLFACVHALQEYTNDMVNSSSHMDPDTDESYDADIYMLSWEIFCKHAFSNPDEFNILFFSRHSEDLPSVLKEYLDLFPPERDTSSDVFLEAMFRATSLQDRNLMLLVPLLEGRVPDNDIILSNDMTVAFFYALLTQLLGNDRGVTPESQTARMLDACRKVALI
ncbi:MAG: TetR/AcrR family transcriptional regulator [Mogibacterium sp.]|nr:TetR/AcrR family transcriptional regulator [Mogibacterium sp.]